MDKKTFVATTLLSGCTLFHYDNGNPPVPSNRDAMIAGASVLQEMTPEGQARREVGALTDELSECNSAIGEQLSEIVLSLWQAKTQTMCEDAVLGGPHTIIDPNLSVGLHAIDANGKYLADYDGVGIGAQFLEVSSSDMPCLRVALSDLQVPTDFIDTDGDDNLDTVEFGDIPGDYCNIGYTPSVDGGFYAFVSCDGYPSDGHQVIVGP